MRELRAPPPKATVEILLRPTRIHKNNKTTWDNKINAHQATIVRNHVRLEKHVEKKTGVVGQPTQ